MAEDNSTPYGPPGTPEFKEYHAAKSREWYARQNPEALAARNRARTGARTGKKAAWVRHFGGICAHCQQPHPDCVFEFHHINSAEKETTPAKLFMLSDNRIEAELNKCVMLCANCHRIEHERLKYVDHGKRFVQARELFQEKVSRKGVPSGKKGLPKPEHSEAMIAYWKRRKAAKEAESHPLPSQQTAV